MKLWLNRTAEVSLREQLITQVTLGILSKEIAAGQRLPSTRELARRFGIHANTASSAYKELEQGGWVEFRHGSGVYVRATRPPAQATPEMAADQLLGELAAKARKMSIPQSMLRSRLRRWLAMAPPSRWLVIEPDPELRRIVIHEMMLALTLPVAGCAPDECAATGVLDGAIPAVLPSKAEWVRKLLPPGVEMTVLKVNPVSPEMDAHLKRYLPEHARDLVGIASRWSEFQRVAQTMLIAAGMPPESLMMRDATQMGWKRGLEITSGVVCDAVTALDLPKGVHPLRYTLLDAASLALLRNQEEQLSGLDIPEP